MFRKSALLIYLGFLQRVLPNAGFGSIAGPPEEQPIPPRKESIGVIGTFVPAPLQQHDRSVESFRMRETPLLFNSVIDYLQFDPSIDLQQRAANGVQADLTILGSTFAETLVFARRPANQ